MANPVWKTFYRRLLVAIEQRATRQRAAAESAREIGSVEKGRVQSGPATNRTTKGDNEPREIPGSGPFTLLSLLAISLVSVVLAIAAVVMLLLFLIERKREVAQEERDSASLQK